VIKVAENAKITKKAGKEKNINGTMTVMEHISELRKCLYIIIGTFLITTLASYYFAPKFVRKCLDLAVGYTFVQTSVTELMGQYIKASIICGLVVTAPILIWQIHHFASPGLKKSEDRVFLGVMISGLGFFAIGALFCWVVVVPFTLQFFLSLNTIDVEGMYSVKEYISYLVSMIVAFGIVFEIPVLASILALLGFLKPEPMISARKIVIVSCFVIGAIITPTDVVSQFLVAVPMILLYELSIVMCRVIVKARLKRHPEEEDDDSEEEMRQERQERWNKATAMAEEQSKKK
jgi:sec-independent protein translocase protein TatC